MNFNGTVGNDTTVVTAKSSVDCYAKCSAYQSPFKCRSAAWIEKTKTCTLSAHNRATLAGVAELVYDRGDFKKVLTLLNAAFNYFLTSLFRHNLP